MKFYARSKLANVLFTNSLNKFLKKKKLDVTTYSFHPGVVRTELTREAPSFIQGIARMIGLFLRSPYEGCQTAVYLVCEESQKLKQGEYYANNEVGKMNPNARDEKYCDQFWNESIKLVEDKIGGKLSFLEKQ